jgi:hypothetical protein
MQMITYCPSPAQLTNMGRGVVRMLSVCHVPRRRRVWTNHICERERDPQTQTGRETRERKKGSKSYLLLLGSPVDKHGQGRGEDALCARHVPRRSRVRPDCVRTAVHRVLAAQPLGQCREILCWCDCKSHNLAPPRLGRIFDGPAIQHESASQCMLHCLLRQSKQSLWQDA